MKASTIEPFGADMDRESFGWWLSGFADGEACFSLQAQRSKRGKNPTCRGRFAITLRDDDADILSLIRTFWQCGSILYSQKRAGSRTKPFVTLAVTNFGDLLTTVIPNFERHPLRAKKRIDFAIWKEGVQLAARVAERPRVWPVGVRGSASRWNREELEQFLSLATRLSDSRKYSPRRKGSPGAECRGSLVSAE